MNEKGLVDELTKNGVEKHNAVNGVQFLLSTCSSHSCAVEYIIAYIDALCINEKLRLLPVTLNILQPVDYLLRGTEHGLARLRERNKANIDRAMLERNCEDALKQHRGMLRCSKCSSRNISIQQKQSRAADEGMTLYCHCECGAAWKM